jgi:DNA-binding transcriptional MerR regulator
MSEDFTYHVTELKQVIDKLSKFIDSISSGGCPLDECKALLKEGQEHAQNAQLEARMADDPARKKKLLEQVEVLKNQLNKQKTVIESAQLKLGSGPGGGSGGNLSNQHRGRAEAANEKLARQTEILLNAQRTVAETEGVGSEIVSELASNRSKIEGAREKAVEVKAHLDESGARIDRMQKRDKCVVS